MRVRKLRWVGEKGPLVATRLILHTVWEAFSLEGMLVPVWSHGSPLPQHQRVQDPQILDRADPYSPLNIKSGAKWALEYLTTHPEKNLALLLRPCELECFAKLWSRQGRAQPAGLLMSVDCLACFPKEDLDWRIEAAESSEQITLDVLHFAAQGGILPYRLRQSCQFCATPIPDKVDIHIEVLGLPTQEYLIIGFSSEELAKKVLGVDADWAEIPPEVDYRRTRVMENIRNWRKQSQAYASGKLSDQYKTFEALLEHLQTCTECRELLLDECPILDGDLQSPTTNDQVLKLRTLLASCAGCGICEYSCPQRFPLFNTIQHLASTA